MSQPLHSVSTGSWITALRPALQHVAQACLAAASWSQHGVLELLDAAAPDLLPEQLQESARRARRELLARELLHVQVLQRLHQGMVEAGLQGVLIKGEALAGTLYPCPAVRPRHDIDLWIAPTQRACMEDLLRRLGARPQVAAWGQWIQPEQLWRVPCGQSVIGIDLHWQFCSRPALLQALPLVQVLQRSAAWTPTQEPSYGRPWIGDSQDVCLTPPRPSPDIGEGAEQCKTTAGSGQTSAPAMALPKTSLQPESAPHSDHWGLRLPALEDALLFACIHRRAHHRDGERWIWLLDIALIWARLGTVERETVVNRAVAGKVAALLADALRRVSVLSRCPAPDESVLLDTLERAARHEPARHLLLAPNHYSDLRFDLRYASGRRLAVLRDYALPRADYMRAQHAGVRPAWLPWLYLRRLLRRWQ